MKKIP